MDGSTVIVSDIDEEGGHHTVQLIDHNKGRAVFFRADVRNESEVKQLVSFAEKRFGGLDVLVNNASAPRGDTAIETSVDPIQTDLLGTSCRTSRAR